MLKIGGEPKWNRQENWPLKDKSLPRSSLLFSTKCFVAHAGSIQLFVF